MSKVVAVDMVCFLNKQLEMYFLLNFRPPLPNNIHRQFNQSFLKTKIEAFGFLGITVQDGDNSIIIVNI
jgi:hypothetical protein